MAKYAIKDISDIKLILPKLKTIKQNKPAAIKVSRKEYIQFLNNNSQYIKERHLNTVCDNYIIKDLYGNKVAYVNYYIEVNYYINPKLLKLGLKEKKYIENEYEKIGEEFIDLGDFKSISLNNE